MEAKHPGSKQYLEDFLLALSVHIRYHTTLESSIEWAVAHRTEFDGFVRLDAPK